jgi:hypothetical protein
MKWRAVGLWGLFLAACGPKTEPAAPSEPAAAATPPSATPPASAAPTTEAPPPAVAEVPSPAAEAKPPAPSIHDVCFAMCDRVKAKCPKSAFDSCRVNCTKYDPPPDGCEDVVRAALECARDAADLVCANVAPESCAKPFRHITACASGKQPTTTNEPTTAALPAGFALFTSASDGVHAPMPEGAAAGSSPSIIATAKHASGAVYTIRKLPRPVGKLNEKVFLKIAMAEFGRCTDKMKMQGMVDKPGRTSINYTMKCPDGASERGLFWATDQALFIASARGSSEDLGPTDAFLYGFEAK